MDKSFPFFYPHPTPNYDHNYEDSDTSSTNITTDTRLDRDYMFEKPLTPSDVGKLNRLVIPKQHAERYLPLAGGEKSVGAGGVLLGFEDDTGKCWRFRYSYWNSSQSYVLTKGWSRYVKEKKLESGDVVLFERHRSEPDRFFIAWRRRKTDSGQTPVQPVGEEGCERLFYNAAAQVQLQGYPSSHPITAYPYHPDCFHAGTDMIRNGNNEIQKTPKPGGGGNSKTLRLFGVNLECHVGQEDEENPTEPQTSDGSSLSSHEDPGQGSGQVYVGPTGYSNYSYDYVGYPPTNLHNQYMGMM